MKYFAVLVLVAGCADGPIGSTYQIVRTSPTKCLGTFPSMQTIVVSSSTEVTVDAVAATEVSVEEHRLAFTLREDDKPTEYPTVGLVRYELSVDDMTITGTATATYTFSLTNAICTLVYDVSTID